MNILIEFNDSQLSQQIKNSDSRAFKVLFNRYYKNLYSYFWLRTRSADISKDFIQEVFTKLWITRENINPELSIKSYLFRISHNILIDFFRKKKTESLPEGMEPVSQDFIDQAEYFDLEENISIELSKLPEDMRTVFLMSRIDGLKYTEIAETLDISIKTVESRMSKALKLLRESLKHFLVNLLYISVTNLIVKITTKLIG